MLLDPFQSPRDAIPQRNSGPVLFALITHSVIGTTWDGRKQKKTSRFSYISISLLGDRREKGYLDIYYEGVVPYLYASLEVRRKRYDCLRQIRGPPIYSHDF